MQGRLEAMAQRRGWKGCCPWCDSVPGVGMTKMHQEGPFLRGLRGQGKLDWAYGFTDRVQFLRGRLSNPRGQWWSSQVGSWEGSEMMACGPRGTERAWIWLTAMRWAGEGPLGMGQQKEGAGVI